MNEQPAAQTLAWVSPDTHSSTLSTPPQQETYPSQTDRA